MNDNDVIEIDLIHIFKLLLSKALAITISSIVCGAIGFCIAYFLITPKYESSALFYVNNNNLNIGSSSFSISSSDISASQSLVDTYIVILKTRNTLETVIEKSDLDYTYSELISMISASAVNGTEVFKVTVNSSNANEACLIANAIAKVLPDKIAEIVSGSGAKVVDYAVVESNKVSPSINKYTLMGVLIGLFISCGFIVLEDLFDTTIREESVIINKYPDIPVLAIIPDLSKDKKVYGHDYLSDSSYYQQIEKKN